MNKHAIIYLHGFNSASMGLDGRLLTSKDKLLIMQEFCLENGVHFFSPNVDYRAFRQIVDDMLFECNRLLGQGSDVIFMGSSMGGFAGEYLAMKTGRKAVMINPASYPSTLLAQFVGVSENYETGQPYHWDLSHCRQYAQYEAEIAGHNKPIDRTILLDMADELIDAEKTRARYQSLANVVTFAGGSHGFEHMRQALPVIRRVIGLEAGGFR